MNNYVTHIRIKDNVDRDVTNELVDYAKHLVERHGGNVVEVIIEIDKDTASCFGHETTMIDDPPRTRIGPYTYIYDGFYCLACNTPRYYVTIVRYD